VGGAADNDVVERSGAAEELNAVILAAVDLDIAELGVRTTSAQRQTVQLIVWTELAARVLDANIAKGTAVAGVVRAAVASASITGGEAFDAVFQIPRGLARIGAGVTVRDALT